MGAVYFYHLTRSNVERALPPLIAKALAAGWRVAVRGTGPERLAALDRALWTEPAESFLPHGIAGGPHDARQPVLLTTGAAANGAACLMAIDGAALTPGEAAALERACILFDGQDRQAVEAARAQWRSLTGAGLAAVYWAEAERGWVKQAEA